MCAYGAAGASGGAAAIAQATRALGVIVRVEPDDLLAVVQRNEEPLVVHAMGGFFTKNHQYLTSYRGLAFFAKSESPLDLPSHCQIVEARKIWIPGGTG